MTARGSRSSPSAASYPLVVIYADESCLGNGRQGDNPGGAGALFEYVRPRTGALVRRDLWLSEPATTNNRMALRSVIESFRALSRKNEHFSVIFTSDSRYLIDGLSSWVHGWAKRGWRRKTGEIENLGLWHDALEAVRPHRVEWKWVRGHAGHPQNEYANFLATRAAAQQSNSEGLVKSQFEHWLASQLARGITNPIAPFPSLDSFKASAELPRLSTVRP